MSSSLHTTPASTSASSSGSWSCCTVDDFLSRRSVRPRSPIASSRAGCAGSASLRSPTMLLMWRAGLRVGEVCALRVRDVNLATGEVRIEEGKGADGESAYFDPALVSPMLERWLSMRKRLGFDNARTLFCTVKSSDTPMGG